MWHETSLEPHIAIPTGNDAHPVAKLAIGGFVAMVLAFGVFVASRSMSGPPVGMDSLQMAAQAAP
jgi:hypothetical protein